MKNGKLICPLALFVSYRLAEFKAPKQDFHRTKLNATFERSNKSPQIAPKVIKNFARSNVFKNAKRKPWTGGAFQWHKGYIKVIKLHLDKLNFVFLFNTMLLGACLRYKVLWHAYAHLPFPREQKNRLRL